MLNVLDEAMKDSKNEENQTVIRWVINKRLKLMALGLGVQRANGSLKPITLKHHQSAILNHLNPRVPERISQVNILTTRIKYNSLRLKL